jgi:PTB domain (IRS-1 type)/FERM central domain/EF-hand domain pair
MLSARARGGKNDLPCVLLDIDVRTIPGGVFAETTATASFACLSESAHTRVARRSSERSDSGTAPSSNGGDAHDVQVVFPLPVGARVTSMAIERDDGLETECLGQLNLRDDSAMGCCACGAFLPPRSERERIMVDAVIVRKETAQRAFDDGVREKTRNAPAMVAQVADASNEYLVAVPFVRCGRTRAVRLVWSERLDILEGSNMSQQKTEYRFPFSVPVAESCSSCDRPFACATSIRACVSTSEVSSQSSDSEDRAVEISDRARGSNPLLLFSRTDAPTPGFAAAASRSGPWRLEKPFAFAIWSARSPPGPACVAPWPSDVFEFNNAASIGVRSSGVSNMAGARRFVFALSDLSLKRVQNTHASPSVGAERTIGVLWDCSRSRGSSDAAEAERVELSLLTELIRSLFKLSGVTRVRVIIVTFSVAAVVHPDIVISNAARAEKAAEWLRTGRTNSLTPFCYDGGTDMSCLPIFDDKSLLQRCTTLLLFSDGRRTLGSGDLPTAWNVPLFAVSAAAVVDATLLKKWSRAAGGAFFHLSGQMASSSSRQAMIDQVLSPSMCFVGAECASRASKTQDVTVVLESVWPSFRTAVPNRTAFSVSGTFLIQDPDQSPNLSRTLVRIRLFYEVGHQRISTHFLLKLDLARPTQSSEVDPVPRMLAAMWASAKLGDLETRIDGEQDDQSLQLARTFGIVTKDLSLLVLDSLEQFLRYEVEPPCGLVEIRERYLVEMSRRRRDKAAKQEEKMLDVLQCWSRLAHWWQDGRRHSEWRPEILHHLSASAESRLLSAVADPFNPICYKAEFERTRQERDAALAADRTTKSLEFANEAFAARVTHEEPTMGSSGLSTSQLRQQQRSKTAQQRAARRRAFLLAVEEENQLNLARKEAAAAAERERDLAEQRFQRDERERENSERRAAELKLEQEAKRRREVGVVDRWKVHLATALFVTFAAGSKKFRVSGSSTWTSVIDANGCATAATTVTIWVFPAAGGTPRELEGASDVRSANLQAYDEVEVRNPNVSSPNATAHPPGARSDEQFKLRFGAKQLLRQARRQEREAQRQRVHARRALQHGNTSAAREHGLNSINAQQTATRCMQLSSRLEAMSSRLSTAVIAPTIVTGLKFLDSMDFSNPTQISLELDRFERQFEDLGVISEMMDDSLAFSFGGDDDDNPVELLLAEIGDELSLGLSADPPMPKSNQMAANVDRMRAIGQTPVTSGEAGELRNAFLAFDQSGEGEITREGLSGVMAQLGEQLSQKEMDEMLREADVDGDGRVDIDNFVAMMLTDDSVDSNISQNLIDEQDRQLDMLSSSIARTREIATDIGSELDAQNQLLAVCDESVLATGTEAASSGILKEMEQQLTGLKLDKHLEPPRKNRRASQSARGGGGSEMEESQSSDRTVSGFAKTAVSSPVAPDLTPDVCIPSTGANRAGARPRHTRETQLVTPWSVDGPVPVTQVDQDHERTGRHVEPELDRRVDSAPKLQPLRVVLIDGTQKTVLVDAHASVDSIVESVCAKLSMHGAEEYSFQVDDRWLMGGRSLADQGSASRVAMKKRFFMSDSNVDQNNPFQLHLLYTSMRDAVFDEEPHRGLVLSSPEELVTFLALRLQIESGNFLEGATEATLKALPDMLTQQMQRAVGKRVFSRVITDWKKLVGMSETNAKYRFVQLCRSSKYYGANAFSGHLKIGPELHKNARLLINKSLVTFVGKHAQPIIEEPVEHVKRWASAPNTFTIDFGSHRPDYAILLTQEADQISQLLSGYVDILLKQQTRGDATMTSKVGHDDGKSGQQLENENGVAATPNPVSLLPLRVQVTEISAEMNPGDLSSPLGKVPVDDRYGVFLKMISRPKAPLVALVSSCVRYLSSDVQVRALSNLVEDAGNDARRFRRLGMMLMSFGHVDSGVATFERIFELRSDEPQAARDLACALVIRSTMGASNVFEDLERAMGLLDGVVRSTVPSRFAQVEVITALDIHGVQSRLNRLPESFVSSPAASVDPRLFSPSCVSLDLRVVLTWDSEDADVDLIVEEPGGDACTVFQNQTPQGGFLSLDQSRGLGPEEYRIRQAPRGKFLISVRLASRLAEHEKDTGVMAMIHVFTEYGTDHERQEVFCRQLSAWRERISLAEVHFPPAPSG